ncbi:MAG: hypothetical protein BWY74_00124 [Firmicutes bacterium ADurb.Bin419]|nr:MAG: hypothetical protein BWY74_00124 [Firmicutes bacterium ADurb.Bin419]
MDIFSGTGTSLAVATGISDDIKHTDIISIPYKSKTIFPA